MSVLSQQEDAASLARTENARVGYQVAIELWAHAGDEVWARFNVMLVANSIIIAVVGFLLTEARMLPAFNVALPIVGVLLCILWFVMMTRGNDYQLYYLLAARELEEQYLSDPLNTVSRGGTLADGETISLKIAGTSMPFRMGLSSRLTPAKRAAYMVILIFGAVYVTMLLASVILLSAP